MVFVAFTHIGCGRTGFVEPVTSFQEASLVVIASTRLYLTELNKVEREHYLTDQGSKKLQISLPDLEAVQVFSQESLRARLDALDQLARYGALLSRVAKSDAPERLKAETEALGTSLKGVTETVNSLQGADDTGFKTAVGAAATLIGEVLTLIVEQRLRDALKTAVDRGEQPINRLVAATGEDVIVAYERKRTRSQTFEWSLLTNTTWSSRSRRQTLGGCAPLPTSSVATKIAGKCLRVPARRPASMLCETLIPRSLPTHDPMAASRTYEPGRGDGDLCRASQTPGPSRRGVADTLDERGNGNDPYPDDSSHWRSLDAIGRASWRSAPE